MPVIENYTFTGPGVLKCTTCGFQEDGWDKYVWENCPKCGVEAWYVIDENGKKINHVEVF